MSLESDIFEIIDNINYTGYCNTSFIIVVFVPRKFNTIVSLTKDVSRELPGYQIYLL